MSRSRRAPSSPPSKCTSRATPTVFYNNEEIALEPYGNGATGVTAVAVRDDFIIVRFKNSVRDTYVYDREKPGPEHLERMKWILRKGSGLTTYINRNVHDYAHRLPG
jgi:hypothetical protein